MAPEYVRVYPTDAERDAWRRKHPRQSPPYRVQCYCGARFWLSGIGLGSHRRSAVHRAARPARIAAGERDT